MPRQHSASVVPFGGPTASPTTTGISLKIRPMPRGLRGYRKGHCESQPLRQDARLKTCQPLILTARIDERDLEPFDHLRRENFPPERNFLRAHLTMFHRLPGECLERIIKILEEIATKHGQIAAEVNGIRHLGAGVSFTINSPEINQVHAELKSAFSTWLGGQDMQRWQPHITVQNKVSRPTADALHQRLSRGFKPGTVTVKGMDLWRYMGGPWTFEKAINFSKLSGSGRSSSVTS